MLMLWENGHIKINLSGKSKSEHLNASANTRIYRLNTRHILCGTETICTLVEQMNADCLYGKRKMSELEDSHFHI